MNPPVEAPKSAAITPASGRLELQFERTGELEASTRHVRVVWLADYQLARAVGELTRLARRHPCEQHLAGFDERACSRATGREPTRYEQNIDALLRHVLLRSAQPVLRTECRRRCPRRRHRRRHLHHRRYRSRGRRRVFVATATAATATTALAAAFITTTAATTGAASQTDLVGHDLGRRALVAVLVFPAFPAARLDAAFDPDRAALAEDLVEPLAALAPHDDRVPVGALLALARFVEKELLFLVAMRRRNTAWPPCVYLSSGSMPRSPTKIARFSPSAMVPSSAALLSFGVSAQVPARGSPPARACTIPRVSRPARHGCHPLRRPASWGSRCDGTPGR